MKNKKKFKSTSNIKSLNSSFPPNLKKHGLLINQFFKDFIPSFEIAQKLWLSIDVQQLAKDIEGIAVFSSDGASLLVPKNKLTDNEALSLWLTTYYLGYKLGIIVSDAFIKG